MPALTIAVWLLVFEFAFYMVVAYRHANDPSEINLNIGPQPDTNYIVPRRGSL